MTSRWLLVVTFLSALTVGHIATLHAIPTLIMHTAYKKLGEGGVPINDFFLSPRITPESQAIVRSSPDMAYSVCRIDLSDGPVRLAADAWGDYGSISVYGSDTDNLATVSIGPDSPGSSVIVEQGKPAPSAPEGSVLVKDDFAIAIIRRLAPTAQDYTDVELAASKDICTNE